MPIDFEHYIYYNTNYERMADMDIDEEIDNGTATTTPTTTNEWKIERMVHRVCRKLPALIDQGSILDVHYY